MPKATRISIAAVALLCSVLLIGLVPPVADQINRQGIRLLSADNPRAARWLFGYLHVLGNGDATNNLGVLYRRGLGVERDRKKAIAFFEEAVGKEVVQARYNLVLTMPNRFKTPDAVVERQLSLLEENVALGDIPSHVLYADRLYYVNREKFVPNREARKMDVLEVAARTGDPDYIYQYGEELEVRAFKRDDAEMMARALRAYRSAYDKGNIRGAEALGSARSVAVWNTVPSREEILEKSEAEWTLIAAEGGSITAKCRHTSRRFDWIGEWDEMFADPLAQQEMIDRYLAQDNPTPWRTSIAYLEECAAAKRLRFPPNPPFGDTALYAIKIRGTVPALFTSPLWSNYRLGQLYALGIHVERDIAKAVAYFGRAEISDSEAWIEYLNTLREEQQNQP